MYSILLFPELFIKTADTIFYLQIYKPATLIISQY